MITIKNKSGVDVDDTVYFTKPRKFANGRKNSILYSNTDPLIIKEIWLQIDDDDSSREVCSVIDANNRALEVPLSYITPIYGSNLYKIKRVFMVIVLVSFVVWLLTKI